MKNTTNYLRLNTNVCLYLFLAFFSFSSFDIAREEVNGVITISGRVTDFEGNAIDSAIVTLKHRDFSTAYEIYSDKNGYYELKNVKRGNYMSMYVLRPKEYPRANAVPQEDMRLEFWAWNIIADRDLVINPRYDKLELYGTTVFEELGGRRELLVHFRPMSVTKNLIYGKDVYLDKSKLEEVADISVKPENLELEVYADDEPLKVYSIHPLNGYGREEDISVSYLARIERPKKMPTKPYVIFRVVATNKEFNEKGENLYFYKLNSFE